MNLVVKFTAEVIGDLSVVSLLNTAGDKLKVDAFHDTNPTAQALLRKLFGPNLNTTTPKHWEAV